MIQGIIFDLGSTLIHTDHGLNWALILNRMRADLLAHLLETGCAVEPDAFLARFAAKLNEFSLQRQTDWVEYTTSWILRSTLADMGAPPPAPELLRRAVAAYFGLSETLWRPLPGLLPLLEQLAADGYQLGLISNASDDGNVQRLIDRVGLRPFLDPIVVSAAVGFRKPNPRIFDFVLVPWGLPAADCVMVGDTLGADILGAQLAGLHNVWVTAQAGTPANQAHRGSILPQAEIGTVLELNVLLQRWRVTSGQPA